MFSASAMETVKAFRAKMFRVVLWSARQMPMRFVSTMPPHAAFMALGVPSSP